MLGDYTLRVGGDTCTIVGRIMVGQSELGRDTTNNTDLYSST